MEEDGIHRQASLGSGVEMGHGYSDVSQLLSQGWAASVQAAPGCLDLHLLICWHRSKQCQSLPGAYPGARGNPMQVRIGLPVIKDL